MPLPAPRTVSPPPLGGCEGGLAEARPAGVSRARAETGFSSLVVQMVKNPSAVQETLGSPSRVPSLGREEPLEKGMATHSSILAWRIPRTKEIFFLKKGIRKKRKSDYFLTFPCFRKSPFSPPIPPPPTQLPRTCKQFKIHRLRFRARMT